jgi:imidazole glycerol-phosphate synthase subunit HisH
LTTIVDYGAGNLCSVRNTLDALGAEYRVTSDPQDVTTAEKVILPGVGHFGQMIRALDDRALRAPLLERIAAGVPFLGICVGLQCLFERSEEAPEQEGLGIFRGTVARFGEGLRVPHMGWNSLERTRESRLLAGLPSEPYTYFAHSYFAPVTEATAATCTYAQPYSAVLERENVYAVQFHPEKSAATGLHVVRNFLEI